MLYQQVKINENLNVIFIKQNKLNGFYTYYIIYQVESISEIVLFEQN
jgi:hypothetical protein